MMQYHNPKGTSFPLACDRENLCAVYVARYADGLGSYQRFMRSLGTGRFGLFIVYKGFPDIETACNDWHPHCPHAATSATMMPDKGYDLTAYRIAAEMVSTATLVFFNSNTELLCPNWPELYLNAINQPGVGLVGATGSWESFEKGSWWRRLLFPPFPNPHIRTNAFCMRRNLFLSLWPKRFRTKKECYLFESGHNSLTRRVWREWRSALVVDSAGKTHNWWDWRKSNTFRAGSQHGLIASDCRTRDYYHDKERLEDVTWGN